MIFCMGPTWIYFKQLLKTSDDVEGLVESSEKFTSETSAH